MSMQLPCESLSSLAVLRLTRATLQIYVPRIPGVPNDLSTYPDRLNLYYEVRCAFPQGTSAANRHHMASGS